MNSAVLVLLGSAGLLVAGTAIARSVTVESAPRSPPSRRIFRRLLDAMIEPKRRRAQLVIDRYAASAALRAADDENRFVRGSGEADAHALRMFHPDGRWARPSVPPKEE